MNDVKNALHVLEKRIVHLEKLPGHSKVARTKVKKLAEKVPLKKWFTKSNSVLHDVYNYTKKRISHGK
jgi:hypothetical protein